MFSLLLYNNKIKRHEWLGHMFIAYNITCIYITILFKFIKICIGILLYKVLYYISYHIIILIITVLEI